MAEFLEKHPDGEITHNGDAESPQHDADALDEVDRQIDALTQEIHNAAAEEDEKRLAEAQAELRALLAKEHPEARDWSKRAELPEVKQEEEVVERRVKERPEARISPNLAEDLFVGLMMAYGTRQRSLENEGKSETAAEYGRTLQAIRDEFDRYDQGLPASDLGLLGEVIQREKLNIAKKVKELKLIEGSEPYVEALQEEYRRWQQVEDNIEDGVNPPWTPEIGFGQEEDEDLSEAPTEVTRDVNENAA